MPRESFRDQFGMNKASTMSYKMNLANEIEKTTDDITAPFETAFEASDMRQLALVAHNHMKPAMKEFIETYSEVLKKFRITGTQTTMRMCKGLWGADNPDVEYGLTCTSGPLGGDAQIAALMCMEDLGALIFFVDPLSAHPHQADIDSLVRLANCGNVIVCPNPTSAMSMMHTLKCALEKGNRGMIPSFFETLESPAVAEYKAQQELALAHAVNAKTTVSPKADLEEIPEEESDDDDEEVDVMDIVEKRQSRSSVVRMQKLTFADEPEEIQRRPNRASTLYGISMPIEKQSKKKKFLKKLGKSMRRLGSMD